MTRAIYTISVLVLNQSLSTGHKGLLKSTFTHVASNYNYPNKISRLAIQPPLASMTLFTLVIMLSTRVCVLSCGTLFHALFKHCHSSVVYVATAAEQHTQDNPICAQLD